MDRCPGPLIGAPGIPAIVRDSIPHPGLFSRSTNVDFQPLAMEKLISEASRHRNSDPERRDLIWAASRHRGRSELMILWHLSHQVRRLSHLCRRGWPSSGLRSLCTACTAAIMSDSSDSIDDTLGADHEYLDTLLRALESAVSAGSVHSREATQRFSQALQHHMKWEEDRLFPAVKEQATDRERRSIESLEIDHDRLRDALHSLESALEHGKQAAVGNVLQWLGVLLKGHNFDEEHGVYVVADRVIGSVDRKRLIEQFKAGQPKLNP